MNFVDQIKNKLTMLQDDFGEDDAPTESDNSTAPEAPAEEAVEETEDHGTDDHHKEDSHDYPAEDCEVSLFGSCLGFEIWRYTIQAMTVGAFFLMVTVNFASSYFPGVLPLADMTEYWNLAIDPAGWTFSIWGVIYSGLAMFVLYQMVPSGWIEYLGGKRNDEMIFIYGNFVFIVNMILNAAWLPIFQSNTQSGFIVSWFIILGIWATNTYMMVISQRFETWWLENLVMRIPFSLYSGWVTCATVLNTFYLAASLGMRDTPKVDINRKWIEGLDFMMFISEEAWTSIALWTVFFMVEIVAYWERNPLWGSVFSWAVAGIIGKNVDKLGSGVDEHYILLGNAGIIEFFNTFSMIVLDVYLTIEELQPWFTPISFWNGGLYGLTDWSVLFTNLKSLLSYPESYFANVAEARLPTM